MVKSGAVVLAVLSLLALGWIGLRLAGLGPAPAPAAPGAAASQPADGLAAQQNGQSQADAKPSVAGGHNAALTDKQEKEVLAFLKARHPTSLPRLADQKQSDPAGYDRIVGRIYRFMKSWEKQPQEIRDAVDREKTAQLAVMDVIRQIRCGEDAVKAAGLKKELQRTVSLHFDMQQELREARLAWLEQQIGELRAELKDQQEQREQIIQERIGRWMKAAKPLPVATGAQPTTRPASE